MIAYLSSEFAVSEDLPLYAGGLGVLANDLLRQSSDSRFPLIGISIFYREGFFRQKINQEGNQIAEYLTVDPQKGGLEKLDITLEVPLPGRKIYLTAWRKFVGKTSLYLLDADLPQNSPEDRKLTARLYERIWAPHLAPDVILGVGAVRLARALNLPVKTWHLNDDHVTFCVLERLREEMEKGLSFEQAQEHVSKEFVYTTHTPVANAESVFPASEIETYLSALGIPEKEEILSLGERGAGVGPPISIGEERHFSLTVFAMKMAGKINAVSRLHEKVAKKLWNFVWEGRPEDQVPIFGITNGVYPSGWVGEGMSHLFDQYLLEKPAPLSGAGSSGWDFSQALKIPDDDLWQAKHAQKEKLASFVESKTGIKVDPGALFLVWARRFAEYKRPQLLLSDKERLAEILQNKERPAFLFMAGKSHPQDAIGGSFIQEVVNASRDSRFAGRLIFLENYNLDLAKSLVQGADVWLNTPQVGFEACGTSGMKAVYNSTLNCSTLDGWWWEASNADVGWVIKEGGQIFQTAQNLYALLEGEIVPLYYQDRPKWLGMAKEALAQLGSRFTSERMLGEYRERLYS